MTADTPAPQGLLPAEARQWFLKHIHTTVDALRAADAPVTTLEQWRDRKASIRQGLREAWGGLAATTCELNPQRLGLLRRDGYSVEKVLFQTLPGVWMTGNVYVPDWKPERPVGANETRPPLPAVLCVHGHWKHAKQEPVVQARCIGLAKLGFLVLCVDAFGAGERAIGTALGEYHGEMSGATLLPTGFPLSGVQVYENMRAVDYLLSRGDVDPERLGITGASGGGNQSMYGGAFDERFKAVVPVCSVGTYRAYLGTACCVCEVVPGAARLTEEWGILSLVAPRALMVVSATKDAFQFSVAEAEKSLAKAKAIFELHGVAANVKHAVFDWHHDYSQPMREAMYGWMLKHLADKGDGSPVAEPAHTTEEPETLRCFPGDSRPADYVTLPKFAARLGTELATSASAEPILHEEHWQSIVARTTSHLYQWLKPAIPYSGPATVAKSLTAEAQFAEHLVTTESGIEVPVRVTPARVAPSKEPLAVTVVVGTDGAEAALKSATEAELKGVVVAIELPATGRLAPERDTIGRAPDHNSGEWALWVGRPLVAQWAFTIIRVVETLPKLFDVPSVNVRLVGEGSACLAANMAALSLLEVKSVRLRGGVATFVSDQPLVGQRLGGQLPGVLRKCGDVAHLAACLAPRPLEIVAPVGPDGLRVTEDRLTMLFAHTRKVYGLLKGADSLTLRATDG
jgi:dienelactone hydrolase